jgi:hypothetical protein
VRRQVEKFLARLLPFPHGAEELRISRTMLALEWMDAPEAWHLIETLAQGPPEARLTQAAQAARQRLSHSSFPKPNGALPLKR